MHKSRGFEGELIIEIPKTAAQICRELPFCHSLYLSRMGFYPRALNHYYYRPAGISETILIYCTGGSGWIQINKRRITVQPGEVFLFPKDVPHSYGADADSPWTIYWLHITGDNASDAISAIMGAQSEIFHAVSVGFSEKRNAVFRQISATYLKGYSTANLMFANLLLVYYLSSFIAPEQFEKDDSIPSPETVTERAIRVMQENLSNKLTLENIARSVNLSVSFFSRKFRQETGYPPIDYFNHLRIQRACQLLHIKELRVNEVALQLGFDDAFYFSRLFKSQIGQSPQEYRKKQVHAM